MHCYWAMDLNDTASGSVFKNPANPQGVILDGRAGAKLNTKTDIRWFLVRGPQWGMVEAMIFSRDLSALLTRTTLVREELVDADSAEDHPGRLLVGYWVKVIDRVPKGVYRWQLYHYYPYPFTEDRAQEILNLIEHPLQVSVVPIGGTSTLTQ